MKRNRSVKNNIKEKIFEFLLEKNSISSEKSKEQLNEIEKLQQCILNHYPDIEFIEFGSSSAGFQTQDSDRDFLVKQKKKIKTLNNHRKTLEEACQQCMNNSQWDTPAIKVKLPSINLDLVPVIEHSNDPNAIWYTGLDEFKRKLNRNPHSQRERIKKSKAQNLLKFNKILRKNKALPIEKYNLNEKILEMIEKNQKTKPDDQFSVLDINKEFFQNCASSNNFRKDIINRKKEDQDIQLKEGCQDIYTKLKSNNIDEFSETIDLDLHQGSELCEEIGIPNKLCKIDNKKSQKEPTPNIKDLF